MPRYRRRHTYSLATILIAIAIYVIQQQGWLSSLPKQAEVSQPGSYLVTRYVDGDTISVDMNGTKETIRFIGIDTPETHKPNTPVQCYGPAAAAHTKNVIVAHGGRVRLASDPLTTNRDRYNRLLRYIYLTDGTNLNKLNVSDGYAFYYPFFPFSKSAEFSAAQQQAKAANKGLWGNCTPTPVDGGGYKMEELAH